MTDGCLALAVLRLVDLQFDPAGHLEVDRQAKSLILDLAEKLDAPGLQFGDGRLQFVGVERDRGGGLPG